jgi:hypothetical protein
MRPAEFDPDLTYYARVAADWYGITPSEFIRMAVQRYCDELADWNPNVRAAYAMIGVE